MSCVNGKHSSEHPSTQQQRVMSLCVHAAIRTPRSRNPACPRTLCGSRRTVHFAPRTWYREPFFHSALRLRHSAFRPQECPWTLDSLQSPFCISQFAYACLICLRGVSDKRSGGKIPTRQDDQRLRAISLPGRSGGPRGRCLMRTGARERGSWEPGVTPDDQRPSAPGEQGSGTERRGNGETERRET